MKQIKVGYRLVGSVNNPILTKYFETEAEFEAWREAQVNILILFVEREGTAALARVYGF